VIRVKTWQPWHWMAPGRILYAKRINEQYIRLKGCRLPFLDSLPPFPG